MRLVDISNLAFLNCEHNEEKDPKTYANEAQTFISALKPLFLVYDVIASAS